MHFRLYWERLLTFLTAYSVTVLPLLLALDTFPVYMVVLDQLVNLTFLIEVIFVACTDGTLQWGLLLSSIPLNLVEPALFPVKMLRLVG